jgi:hypothetical protein
MSHEVPASIGHTWTGLGRNILSPEYLRSADYLNKWQFLSQETQPMDPILSHFNPVHILVS